jgi:hypothetical protein
MNPLTSWIHSQAFLAMATGGNSGAAYTDLPDPELVEFWFREDDDEKYIYKPAAPGSRLFGADVSADDVKQGRIADCTVAASLAALASSNSQSIRRAARENQNGTFTVRFYRFKNGQAIPEDVTVDGDLPHGAQGPAYASSTEAGELWPAIIEKAYAEFRGSYDAIGHGGDASDVIAALTGKPVTRSNQGGDQGWARLREAIANKQPIVATTPKDATKEAEGAGAYGWHAFTVLDVEEGERGQRLVVVRNPWAQRFKELLPDSLKGLEGKAVDDGGKFKMTWEEFQSYFERFDIGARSPEDASGIQKPLA